MRPLQLAGFAALAALAATAARAADVAEVLHANAFASGAAALRGKASLDLTWNYLGQGMAGEARSIIDLRSGAFVDSGDIGPTHTAQGFDGRTPWMRDLSGATTPQLGGDLPALAVNEAYRNANLWWRPGWGGAEIRWLRQETQGADRYEVLSVTPRGGKTFEAWFGVADHQLARTVETQGVQTITTSFSDYRPVDGVAFAGKIVIGDGSGPDGAQVQTLRAARFGPARPRSAYSPPRVTLADARIDNPSGRTTVSFQLLNNHIYAPVRINGQGPFTCIFDTGGLDLLVPAAAKALSVASEGRAEGRGAGEGVVEMGFARGVRFQIGDLQMDRQSVPVLPFVAPDVEGLDEKGMIGFEVFRRFVVRIDYGRRTLTFIDPARFDPADAGAAVPLKFYSHNPQVDGAFEGIPGRFDIDTGSRTELTLTKPFVVAHGLIASHPHGVVAVDGWGVGGPSRDYVTRATRLDLGPVRIDGLVAGLSVQDRGAFADPTYAGNVGSALLKRFVVTFDYGRGVMYLKPQAGPVADQATFDRAGLWINRARDGFAVMDVSAGGAAAAAGLKVGDHIVQVDGARASDLVLSDLRQRLRTDPVGTQVGLTVRSDGVDRAATLVLKDQI